MSRDDLKEELHSWVDQIGPYNEGCGCPHCTKAVFDRMNVIMEEYLKQVTAESIKNGFSVEAGTELINNWLQRK